MTSGILSKFPSRLECPKKLPLNKWVWNFNLRGREFCEPVVVEVIQKYEFQYVTTLEVLGPEEMELINKGTNFSCNIQLYSEPQAIIQVLRKVTRVKFS